MAPPSRTAGSTSSFCTEPSATASTPSGWIALTAALLAALRRRLRLEPRVWRLGHTTLAAVVVVGSVVHALLIEGTMGMVSKAALCALVLAATAKVMVDLRSWSLLTRRRADQDRFKKW